MKTKVLFLVVLLGLTPALSTATYGQVGLIGTLLTKAIEKKKSNRMADKFNRIAIENNSSDRTVDCSDNNSNNAFNNSANSNDEVTLVVTGKAATAEKATTIALRSAIEQAYGTFVSANTTILNDDLVKDEIVTISNGNIKSYRVLNEVKCEDGQMMITLDAKVCISKLVNYAKSKGASTEFAGATFAQNMKMKELNKKNELQALQNVLSMVKELLPVTFDKKLYVLDPTIPKSRFSDSSLPDPTLNKQYNHYQNLTDGYYQMEMHVVMEPRDNAWAFLNTLGAIAMNQEEIAEYKKVGMNTSRINVFGRDLTFRNSKEETTKWLLELINLFDMEFSNFKIVDNLGEVSTFKGSLMATDASTRNRYSTGTVDDYKRLEKYGIMEANGTDYFFSLRSYFAKGTGIFKDGLCASLHLPKYEESERVPRFVLFGLEANDDLPKGMEEKDTNKAFWILTFRIPASEISKYSYFKLEPNN